MRIVFLAGVVVAGLMVASAANAASFTNGSFEQPGGEVRQYLTPDMVPGWTYDTHFSGQDIYESDDQGDGLTAADGAHYISFGHNGTWGGSISQTFDTTVGATYTVSYAVAEQQGDDSTQELQLTVTNGGFTLTQDNDLLGQTFAYNSVQFVAASTTATLTFLDNTPIGGGFNSNLALDDVRVNGSSGEVSSVPEPATWAMMLVGFGGVGAVMRKARRTKAITA